MPIANINDIKIYYEIEGKGDALVLLHGAQGDITSFNNIIHNLSEHFTVVSFDQRGSGKSDKPDMQYTMELLANDTARLMDVIGIEAGHMLGISLGGMIAQTLCINFPSKVKTLTMGCTLPGGWAHAIKTQPVEDALIAFSTDEFISSEKRAHALANVAYSPGYAV